MSLGFKGTHALPVRAQTTPAAPEPLPGKTVVVVPIAVDIASRARRGASNFAREWRASGLRDAIVACIAVGAIVAAEVASNSADLTHQHPHAEDEYTQWAASLQLNLVTVVFSVDLASTAAGALYACTGYLQNVYRLLCAFGTAFAAVPLALTLPVYQLLHGTHCADEVDRLQTTTLSAFITLVVFASLRVCLAFVQGYRNFRV